MKRYFKYVRPYLLYFILAPVTMLVEVAGDVWMPRLVSLVINNGVANHDVAYILRIGLIMLGVVLMMIAGGVLACYFAAKAAISFSGDLRRDLFYRVEDFAFSDLDDFSTGSLITRLTNDVQQTQNIIMMGLRMMLRSPGMLIGALIMALSINVELALVFIVVIPLLMGALFVIIRSAYPCFQLMQKALDKLNTVIQENLTNVRVVKSFVREAHEEEKFEVRNDRLRERTLEAMRKVILTQPVMMLAMNITTIGVVWFGGNKVIAGTLNAGDLTAFITYVTQILISLMMLAMVILQSARATASFRRISEVLDNVPDITDEGAAFPDKKVEEGSIEFCDVSFRYPVPKLEKEEEEDVNAADRTAAGEDVLSHISFRIEPGETVGILGSTGCGKTTMVQLIPRLYDVTGGRVLVDGTDVRDYSLSNLRDGVSMVLQYNTLFTGTVAENLRFGDENATDGEIEAAAANAQADGFIRQFKYGYDTMIEQGGSNVSGGQKQRLCIARALLKRPKILILDDSTSAVDTATEARIRAAFAKELPGTTKLIIAQRIGSVKDADRIIVMENGRIADSGTHEELIARCREYQEIYWSQVEREEEVGA